jgi:hypothetical protein
MEIWNVTLGRKITGRNLKVIPIRLLPVSIG